MPKKPKNIIDDVVDDAEVEDPDHTDGDSDVSDVDVAVANVQEPIVIQKERYEYAPTTHIEYIYIHPSRRITSEVMTRFEHAEVVSCRAKQIENGAPAYIDTKGLTDPIAIARKEISYKKCPLSIVRALTNTICEKWHVNEMAVPPEY